MSRRGLCRRSPSSTGRAGQREGQREGLCTPLQPGQVDQGVVSAHHAEDMGSGELPSILHELLKPAPRLLRLFDQVSLGARGWSSGSSGLIRSSTGATPFQSFMQFVFQASRSLTRSSTCILVMALSTMTDSKQKRKQIVNNMLCQ